jgi:hypothetical protein
MTLPATAERSLHEKDIRAVRETASVEPSSASSSRRATGAPTRLGTSTESVSCNSGVSRATGPMLSWGFCPSRVLRRARLGRLLPASLLPWASPSRPSPYPRGAGCSPDRLPSGVSLGIRTDAPALANSSTLMRFFNLVSLLESSKSVPVLAHGFASGPEPRHRAPQTLFGLPLAPTGAP